MGRAKKLLTQMWNDYGDPALDAVREAIDGPRPKYVRRAEGDKIVIQRKGAHPQKVPAARAAKSIDDLRVLLKNPKTNPALRSANRESMVVRGRPLTPDEPMPKAGLRRQSGIARAYQAAAEDAPGYKQAVFEAYGNAIPEVVERAKAQNLDQLTEAAYRSLGKDIKHQFDALPITTRYHQGSGEYARPSDMFRDVLENGNLNVFSGGDPHEFLSEIDPQTGLSLNEMFRGVHDYVGHVAPGSTFRPEGEEIAYATHARTLPLLSQIALLSETRGQNSLVNYSPINADIIHQMEAAKADLKLARQGPLVGSTRYVDPGPTNAKLRELGGQIQYAPQKALALPPEYLDPMTPGGIPEYLRDVIRPRAGSAPERAVHLSRTPGLTQLDPDRYGTGHRGYDARQLGTGDPRSHFYLGAEGSVIPEKVVAAQAPFKYEAELSNLYDIESDPEGLIALSRAYNLPEYAGQMRGLGRSAVPDFDRLLREYGYSGAAAPHASGRSAYVFNPTDVQFRPEWGVEPYADGGRV